MGNGYRIPLAIAGVVFLAGMIVLSWRMTHADDTPANDDARLSSLEHRMDEDRKQLDDRLDKLERLIQAQGAPGLDQAQQPDSAAVQAPRHSAMQDQAFYERIFTGDPEGSDSRQLEIDVGRVFSDPGVLDARYQPQARTVECRQHLCAIHMRFAAGADSNEWTTRTLLALTRHFTNSRVSSDPGPDGSTELTIYAFRKGSDALLVDPTTGEVR